MLMELFHVLNRGVEKRNIFLDDKDRFRFVHGLLLFNTTRPANNTTYLIENNDIVSRYTERVVDIHGWCLMKNHYHLLLSERVESGISILIRKLNIGYAKYFNERYKRSGYLFQGRTKKIRVNSEAYFMHILNYVHFNPLDYMQEGRAWRFHGIKNPARAHAHLMKYRWSSYQDYCGKPNFPSILATDLFGESPAKFKRHIIDYSGTNHADVPTQFLLEQNYQNPFNPSTVIRFSIPTVGFVSLTVHNVLGLQVAVLVNQVKSPGIYTATLNASGLPSGVYFYRLRVGSFFETKRLVLLK